MAISKKLRFEVFKRDGFTCGYCGKKPPEITLEVDHINPRAGGGLDEINNLISACFDCNRGKKDIPLKKIPNQLYENIEILREKEAQISAYNRAVAKARRRRDKDINKVDEMFHKHFPGYSLSDSFKNVSVGKFIEYFPVLDLVSFMDEACCRFHNDRERAIRYFCGICWNRIKKTSGGE